MNNNNLYKKKNSFTYGIKNNRNVKISSIIKIIFNISAILILFLFIFTIFSPISTSAQYSDSKNVNPPFSLSTNDVIYNTKANVSRPNIIKEDSLEEAMLNRTKAMTEVKWTPKYNLIEKKCSYIFIKGKTYQGVPYSEDYYQVSSPNNFLSKINNSKILYGDDCSDLVSIAWGINRQTTFSLYNDIRNGYKIGNKYVWQISWNDLRPADALLIDNGRGHGHIMLYINSDKKNSDNLNVYEQDISTTTPYEPIPVAREDIRSKSTLIKEGYIPIRLMNN